MIEKHFSIVIGRSKWLLIYLIIIHNLMLVTMVTLLPNICLSFIAVVIISASFIYYCQRHQWLQSDRAIIKIKRDDRHRWRFIYSNNVSTENLVLKNCVATSKLVILYFSVTPFWNAKSVTIVADAVDDELFRQLRVYLRNPKVFQQ